VSGPRHEVYKITEGPPTVKEQFDRKVLYRQVVIHSPIIDGGHAWL
jgi:hypothetical protein